MKCDNKEQTASRTAANNRSVAQTVCQTSDFRSEWMLTPAKEPEPDLQQVTKAELACRIVIS